MNNLTEKQAAFIGVMKEGQVEQERGFALLAERVNNKKDAAETLAFLQRLKTEDFFNAKKNPAPQDVGEEGSFVVPYWDANGFLLAAAKLSREKDNKELANSIIELVKKVTYGSIKGENRNNYRTWYVFAQILGELPNPCLKIENMDLVQIWLSSRFGKNLILDALSDGSVKNLLSSDNSEDYEKAYKMLEYALNAEPTETLSKNQDYLYVMNEFIEQYAGKFGEKVPQRTAELFLQRVETTFSSEIISPFYRAAVEEHEQNRRGEDIYDVFVVGLRDCLLSWVEVDDKSAKSFIQNNLLNKCKMVRRICIYCVNKRWEQLKELYLKIVDSENLTDIECQHEVCSLLFEHSKDLREAEKTRTIEKLSETEHSHYIAAINGNFDERRSFPAYLHRGRYISRDEKSPYTTEELIKFAQNKTLINQLNDVKPAVDWDTGQIEALCYVLRATIKRSPKIFLDMMSQFSDVKLEYQSAVIQAFTELVKSNNFNMYEGLNLEDVGNDVLCLIEKLFLTEDFWQDDEERGYVRKQRQSAVAEFLGTMLESKSDSGMISRCWDLLVNFIGKISSKEEVSDDAVTQAMNLPKGKAVESMYEFVYSICANDDTDENLRTSVLEKFGTIFMRELEKCKNENFAFSATTGRYIRHIEYIGNKISNDWFPNAIKGIFSLDFMDNFNCAIHGLSYVNLNSTIYEELSKNGIIMQAIKCFNNIGRNHFIERVFIAYLWGNEELDGKHISYLFDNEKIEDLETATELFAYERESIQKDEDSQTIVPRIINFWNKSATWASEKLTAKKTDPDAQKLMGNFLASISKLACFIDKVDSSSEMLLMKSVPYISNKNATGYPLIKELVRLSDNSPCEVFNVLSGLIENKYLPIDTRKLENLLKRLKSRVDERKFNELLDALVAFGEPFTSIALQMKNGEALPC